MSRLPLEGVRIIDSTYIIAMPYAGGMMTDLGAEVIKIEGPTHIDPTRSGTNRALADNEPGEDWWNRAPAFNQINRGKRSLTLDLSKEDGREVLKELIKVSDILVENYTPRVMRRWGLDYPNLKKLKPDIIMVSNTGYGHSEGPYSSYPAQATTQEATHGHTHITGYRGDIPSKAGQSYVDFLASWAGLMAIATALRYRNRTGKGQWLDIGMYQMGVYCTSEYILDWLANGRRGGRIGNRHPWRVPQGCYPCAGKDQWCVISVGDDEEWMALCMVMGRLELAEDPRFASGVDRKRHHDELDDIIRTWTGGLDKFQVMERLQQAGVPAGPVYNGRDINLDPHRWARGFLQKINFPEDRNLGTRVFMGLPWQLSKTPVSIRRPAPTVGQDNASILGELLCLSNEKTAELKEAQIIADRPINARKLSPLNLEKQVRLGLLAEYDREYKAKLGI